MSLPTSIFGVGPALLVTAALGLTSYFVGAGDKHGTVAFAACLAVREFADLRTFVAGNG